MPSYNPFSLSEKTVLVTGASSGIGRAIAIECARLGAKIFLTARSKERLSETLCKIKELSPKNESVFFAADLASEEEIISLVERLPNVSGIVHNAGAGLRVLCKSVKKSDLDFAMQTNFYGPALLQRHILKQKKLQKEGSVVFVSSRAVFSPSTGNSIYAASKGALLAYAKGLALELAPQKIRVNSILPAMVWTDLVKKDAALTGGDYETLQKKYPLGRYGRAEDVAHLAAYLLSDASSWICRKNCVLAIFAYREFCFAKFSRSICRRPWRTMWKGKRIFQKWGGRKHFDVIGEFIIPILQCVIPVN